MDLDMRDTIAACATAPGAAGIAVIRVSGDRAEAILNAVFTPKSAIDRMEHGRLYLGICHDGPTPIDECMAVVMRAPKSYTRQDVAEIQLHGSTYAVHACLDALIRNGARPADPGEFTLRAFLNGRIDLSQAESVMRLIHADSERAGQSALRQLNGGASRFIHGIEKEILAVLAAVEAAIDYPEEVDTPEEARQLAATCRDLAARLRAAAKNRAARMVREGIHIALLGAPNDGKSTLFNALLDEDRSIVTDIPGTTRDVISASFSLDGYSVTLYDTAGLHDTADQIEQLGISRTYQTASGADMIWWLTEAAHPVTEVPESVRSSGLPVWTICTKTDQLPASVPPPAGAIPVSVRTGQGIDGLIRRLKETFAESPETPLTQERHIAAAAASAQALTDAAETLEAGLSQEFAAVHLHEALDILGRITGTRTDESLLDEIFSQFCVGK